MSFAKCSNVWRKYNIEITCNVVAQLSGHLSYLNGRAIWGANGGLFMRNAQSPNVAKMHCNDQGDFGNLPVYFSAGGAKTFLN